MGRGVVYYTILRLSMLASAALTTVRVVVSPKPHSLLLQRRYVDSESRGQAGDLSDTRVANLYCGVDHVVCV